MKKLLMILMVALMPFMAFAASQIEEANKAYNEKSYQKALQLYEAEMKANGTSSDLYYNMGNVYYRMQDYSHAILSYERALVLDPGNSDARDNLEFVRGKAKINTDTGDSFFSNLFSGLVQRLSSNTWAVVAVVMFLLLLISVAVYIFMNNVLLRKIGFFGSFAWLIICIFAICCAVSQRSHAMNHDSAIVMTPQATLSTAPHTPTKKEEAFTLTAGQKVLVEDSVNNGTQKAPEMWYKVEADNGQEAWISSSNVEKI